MEKRQNILFGMAAFLGVLISAVIAFSHHKYAVNTAKEKFQVTYSNSLKNLHAKLEKQIKSIEPLRAAVQFRNQKISSSEFFEIAEQLNIFVNNKEYLGIGYLLNDSSFLKIAHEKTEDVFFKKSKYARSEVAGLEMYKALREAANRSSQSQRSELSSVFNNGDQLQSVLVAPVWANQDQKKIRGWVYYVIQTKDLLALDLLALNAEFLDLHIYEKQNGQSIQVLDYSYFDFFGRDSAENRFYEETHKGNAKERLWKLEHTLRVGGLDYEVQGYFINPNLKVSTILLPLLDLFFGIVLVVTIVLFARSVIQTRFRAQRIAKTMMDDLTRRTEELRAVVDSFPGRISWLDQNLRYVGVNAELARAYNKRPEEFIGNEVGWADKSVEGREFHKQISSFLSSPMNISTEYVMTGSGASEKHFVTTLKKYSNGQMIMAISVDVTAEKKLEKEVYDTKNRAEHNSRLSALGEMAGGMAHEINNPLAIILARATIIKKMIESRGQIADPQKILLAAEKIEHGAERISKIIKGLRAFARDGDKDPFQKSSVNSMIQDVVELCKYKLGNNDILFEYPKNEEDLYIECRANQIVQVLLSLINNSFDALTGCNNKAIRFDYKVVNEHVEFSITDSGPGIPEEVRKKIMQPFFTTKEVGKGTGLGLSVSRGIAVAHQGKLELDPTSQQTRFVLTLPIKRQQETTEDRAA